jgi:hypothetical protein
MGQNIIDRLTFLDYAIVIAYLVILGSDWLSRQLF